VSAQICVILPNMKLREVRSFYIALYFNKKFEGNLSDARPSYMLSFATSMYFEYVITTFIS